MTFLHSIKFKVSILYVSILGAILVCYGAIIYFNLSHTLYKDLNNELVLKADEIGSLIDSFANDESRGLSLKEAADKVVRYENFPVASSRDDLLEARLLRIIDQYDLSGDIVAVCSNGGKILAESFNMTPFFEKEFLKMAVAAGPYPAFADVSTAEAPMRVVTYSYTLKKSGRIVILVATDTRHIVRLLRERFFSNLVLIPVILAATGFSGLILINRILRPVMAVAHTARRITHEDLAARVKVEHMDTEISYLVDSFNDMIMRLEKSFGHINLFSSHVAHELKTPLAIIRGESEVALRKDRSPEEYRQILRLTLKEVKRTIRIIEDMLLLTRLDYERQCLQFENFDFRQCLHDLYENAKILAAPKEIAVEVAALEVPVTLRGDETHLRRLFLNILDNAVKFTPKGGRIRIEPRLLAGDIEVRIWDSGPAISPEDQRKVFEQFYHRDISSDKNAPGTGLGLSIALAISRAHGGDIRIQSRPGEGTAFTVFLPLTAN